MKKKLVPFAAAVILIVVIAAVFMVGTVIERFTLSKEHVGIFAQTEQGGLPVVMDYDRQSFTLRQIDDHLYMDLETLRSQFNSRFYWDEYEKLLLYATSGEIIRMREGEDGGLGWAAAVEDEKGVFVGLDYIRQHTFLDYELFDDETPRVVMWRDETEFDNLLDVLRDTQVRVEADIKAPILADLTANAEPVYFLEESGNFSLVMTKDGIKGYARTRDLAPVPNDTETRVAPDYGSIRPDLLDEKVCMVWHQVTSESQNEKIAEVLASSESINVVSPTWFYLNDQEGGLHSLADSSYVRTCHEQGVQVWGLFSNLENADVDSTYILTHTSVRQALVDRMIDAALNAGLDGINLDFEALRPEVGDSYIQFVRELGLKCNEAGLILSVDNYVPSDYTVFYDRQEQAVFADYIVVMAYDEHYYGSDEGSVASMSFVRDGVGGTIQRYQVPAEQVIQGNPFYTRVWKETPKEDVDAGSVEAAAEDYVNYTLTSEALSMTAAKNRLDENGAEIVYLSDIGQNYGEYQLEGCTYKIWLEDETSVENRMKLFAEFDTGGVAFWKAGLEKSGVWEIIQEYL